MFRVFKQICMVIMTLVLMLMIPLFVENHSSKKSSIKNPSISETAATTSNVLGVTEGLEINIEKDSGFDFYKYKKYVIYILGILFLVSIASFVRFKYLKDKSKNYGTK